MRKVAFLGPYPTAPLHFIIACVRDIEIQHLNFSPFRGNLSRRRFTSHRVGRLFYCQEFLSANRIRNRSEIAVTSVTSVRAAVQAIGLSSKVMAATFSLRMARMS